MNILITNPYNQHIQLTILDKDSKKDGIHLQPFCRDLKVPEGYTLYENDLAQWPKLRVTYPNLPIEE